MNTAQSEKRGILCQRFRAGSKCETLLHHINVKEMDNVLPVKEQCVQSLFCETLFLCYIF